MTSDNASYLWRDQRTCILDTQCVNRLGDLKHGGTNQPLTLMDPLFVHSLISRREGRDSVKIKPTKRVIVKQCAVSKIIFISLVPSEYINIHIIRNAPSLIFLDIYKVACNICIPKFMYGSPPLFRETNLCPLILALLPGIEQLKRDYGKGLEISFQMTSHTHVNITFEY